MYLRHTIRKKNGKVHRYWRLVRSVRVGRRVIQQTVAHLDELDERGRFEARRWNPRRTRTHSNRNKRPDLTALRHPARFSANPLF